MLATKSTVGTVYPTITSVSLDGVPSQLVMLVYVVDTHRDPVGCHPFVSETTASDQLRLTLTSGTCPERKAKGFNGDFNRIVSVSSAIHMNLHVC